MEVTMKKIYFATFDGGIVDNYDIAKAALIVGSETFDPEDLDSVRKYVTICAGVIKELENPSVKYLVANGHKVKAVMLYRDKHPGCTLKQAYMAVNNMAKKLKRYERGER